jgi:CDGSH-type Zn-finger protein
MAQVTIETIKNGPYIVTGEVELIDADGSKFPVEKRMALCRCGASTEKPFCDGTHSKIGFQAAEKAVPESKELSPNVMPSDALMVRVERRIYLIRGEKVMLDHDLAELYGVNTGALNRAVKRNGDRFPGDFMFQLGGDEWERFCFENLHLKKNFRSI